MFTVVAEKINMTRRRVREEVWARNADYIIQLTRRQERAGATHIDLNAGGDPAKEVEDMKWLTGVARNATDLPLVFDSSNPDALRAGLERCNRPGTLINSITLERERVGGVLPLVKEFGTGVVCLTMDDSGMPEDVEGRMRITRDLVALLRENEIALDRAHFDPLVRPASTNPGQAACILECIRRIKEEHPEAHVCLGLSNISFGLPARKNLNCAFLAMLVAAGADGAILDPTEERTMSTLLAARAVLGLDEYGMQYIAAHREGRL